MGFDTTNPSEQLSGERFHSPSSKLGLGDEILYPHHSTAIIYLGGLVGPYQLGFSCRGTLVVEGEFDPA